ncbi:MAG: magnesium chelatase subunit D [Acetobacteraceae bacterium]|nr:magnesium chelatase subunit D [Acetobacteraceae bacterium]
MSAAALLAVDPAGLGGAVLRGPPGPARDRWLDELRALLPHGVPFRRIPLGIGDDRLLGGLDLGATLLGHGVRAQRGVLAEADGGVVLLASAERLPAHTAASIAGALEAGEIRMERDGITRRDPARIAAILFDEGIGPDESVPPSLLDRLAFRLDPREPAPELEGDVLAARALLPRVSVPAELVEALCQTAAALGIDSLRAPLFALRAARAAAALAGRTMVDADDAALAGRLVLAPRATALPAPPPEPPPPEPDQAPSEDEPEPGAGTMDDIVLQAALAALPPDLLARLAGGGRDTRTGNQGRSGVLRRQGTRGRPAGVRPGDPRGGNRLALLDTIRAALPFQRLREHHGLALAIRPGDLRIVRRQPRTESTTIFLVDASGSQALGRLAEAKGAVQLLLADCYVRRDQVALIAFRGRTAELVLPPTRALARAKRSLAGLPGGGGTPLALGLDAGFALADSIRRRGGTPAIVVLTDGSANVGRDGQGGRPAAERDAEAAARQIRAAGYRALLVDSSMRPAPAARRIAEAMGGRYVPLPFAGASAISGLVRSGA